MNVGIIGGGASGMMAALAARETGAKVTLFERQARLGRKLAVTGNGRCNLTNTSPLSGHYHGDEGFALHALSDFDTAHTLEYFRSLGLVTVTEPGGRVYPLSDQASAVVDVLRFALDAAGVDVRCGAEIRSVRKTKVGFLLSLTDGSFACDRLILACGGAAGVKAGGTESGYTLLASLGHTKTPLFPSLVQLKTDGTLTRSLKGIRADGRVAVAKKGRTLAVSEGEIQFTDYGLSGPAIFEISRAAVPGTEVTLDLLRELTEKEITTLLLRRAETCPQLTYGDIFTGILQNRVGRVLLKYAGMNENTPVSRFHRKEAEALSRAAKNFVFSVTGNMGFDGAQVTAGGMKTSEFDPETMESRLVPGLYACGEVLDVDGDCGGYNLQWAWASGRAAGLHAGKEQI